MAIYGRWIGAITLSDETAPSLMQPDDADFAYLESHLVSDGETSYVFTAPQSAWYRIHIVANGGAGGEIGGTASNDYGSCRIPPSGAGGGSGGYAIHVAYLEQGNTISFDLTDAGITATINGLTVQVTSGAAGTAATETAPGVGGAGGTASGANTLNLPGLPGSDGNPERAGTIELADVGEKQRFVGPAGGNGGRVSGWRYLSAVTAPLTVTLGAGAPGAGSWEAWGLLEDGSVQSYGLAEKPMPAAGATGGIVVEMAAL